MAPEPRDVWKMIVRADELVKYAPNRDAADAYAQARAVLADAESAAESLADQHVAENFRIQIRTRLDDIAGRERGGLL
ncbi:MAG: hypothetical protein ABR548_03715 [Actinomycetota bacterium]|nr:hypothetical protein [Actinomycetota bacterium]